MEYKALEKYKALKEKEKEKKLKKEKKIKEKEREKKKEETKKRQAKKRKEAYKPIHIKNLRKKQNARAYKKRRAEQLLEHKKKGDVQGFYRIIIMKNYEEVEELSFSWWMLTAYEKYNNYIKENNEGIICEKIINQSNIQDAEPVKNEILLLKKIDPESDDGVRSFRNELGTFVENKISNNDKYAIIAKSDWYIPETYNVYGYNPVSDRKTGRWIYDNIINKNCCKDNIKNVFMCENKLIVYYNTDFDFIVCKNSNECLRLYNALQAETPKKNKFVIYTNYLVEARKKWLYDLIEKKTGWSRPMITKIKG